MGSDYWQTVLVPQTISHFGKVSTVYISWYRQLYVQMNVVEHIWHEIGIGLRQIKVVDDATRLPLKGWVILEVLGPVFRIRIWSAISYVFLLLEATTYLCVKLTNNGLELICILL